jgi:hypothetical protein
LTAGESIDFIVYGNGGASYLTTGLQGIITGPDLPSSGAPEPGTLAMLLLAAPAIWMRRRK